MSSPNEPSDEEVRQFESGIMLVLCRRHRIKAGNWRANGLQYRKIQKRALRRIYRYCIFQKDVREVKCIK